MNITRLTIPVNLWNGGPVYMLLTISNMITSIHTEICMVAVAALSPGFGLSLLELLSLILVAIRVNKYRPNTLV